MQFIHLRCSYDSNAFEIVIRQMTEHQTIPCIVYQNKKRKERDARRLML